MRISMHRAPVSVSFAGNIVRVPAPVPPPPLTPPPGVAGAVSVTRTANALYDRWITPCFGGVGLREALFLIVFWGGVHCHTVGVPQQGSGVPEQYDRLIEGNQLIHTRF